MREQGQSAVQENIHNMQLYAANTVVGDSSAHSGNSARSTLHRALPKTPPGEAKSPRGDGAHQGGGREEGGKSDSAGNWWATPDLNAQQPAVRPAPRHLPPPPRHQPSPGWGKGGQVLTLDPDTMLPVNGLRSALLSPLSLSLSVCLYLSVSFSLSLSLTTHSLTHHCAWHCNCEIGVSALCEPSIYVWVWVWVWVWVGGCGGGWVWGCAFVPLTYKRRSSPASRTITPDFSRSYTGRAGQRGGTYSMARPGSRIGLVLVPVLCCLRAPVLCCLVCLLHIASDQYAPCAQCGGHLRCALDHFLGTQRQGRGCCALTPLPRACSAASADMRVCARVGVDERNSN